MKKNRTTDAVSTRLTSRSQVQAEFAALPQKFKGSAVGWIYQQITEQLDEAAGEAPLSPLLEALFPEQDAEKARRTLAANYANRAYVADSGLRPLRLRLPLPTGDASGSPPKVWFETETFPSQKFATKDVRPHTHEEFGGGLAAQATGAEVVVAQNQILQTAIATSAALRQSEIESDLAGEDGRGRIGGLRGQFNPKQFQIANAHQRGGMVNHDGLPLAESGLAANKTKPVVGETVVCLDAMLQWATTCKTRTGGKLKYIGTPAHRLLAMLGDYGTGKTSHCLQFARVVNGDVPSEEWAKHQKAAQAQDLALPQAVYIDLAELAGVSLLAELPLEDLLRVVLRRSVAGQPAPHASPEAYVAGLVERARAGDVIFVFDGLDELLKSDRSVLHKVFDQFLKVLEPSRAQKERGEPSFARVVVSCRTHYFRDVEEQHAFFDTRRRGVAQAEDYLCLTMLPWDAATVQSYLAKRLPSDQAEALLGVIQTTYNLEELASRPVLLAMMSEQVGELLRLRDAGEPITAARLYGITVSEWVQRDNTKHRVAPHHKALLMGALAAAMWSEGAEAWSAERLDRWLLPTLARLFPQQYAANAPETLQDDLRTATFIVRPDANRFSFAHRSFLEYFLARFIWDALALCSEQGLEDADLRALLPNRALNVEAQNFLQEICAAQLRRLGTAELRRRALPLWRSLQDGLSGAPLAEEQRANLWRLALSFDHTGAHPQVETRQPSPPLFSADQLAQPINLQGLSFIGEQWQDKDFTYLPPLDLRGANLLKLRAHRVRFGRVLCDSQTNFSQALFRYCDTSNVFWGQVERGGMTLRDRPASPQVGFAGAPAKASLPGPWTRPIGPLGTVVVAFHPQGHQVLTASHSGAVRLWDAASGHKLRQFIGHGRSVTSVAFHPQGRHMLTGSSDGTARLWEVASEHELRQFPGNGDWVTSVAFHPQGHQMLTGSDDGTARLWDVNSEHKVRQFAGHGGWVTSVAFHPQGHQVLAGSATGTARLWDAASGHKVRQFTGHGRSVTSVAFHPQGHQVLTGSADRTARLWDVASGRELCKLTGHGDWVTSVTFHPQGHQVLTGSDDGTARLWDVPGVSTADTDSPGARVRLFVHGNYAPSTALFDAKGNLLDWDDEAIDTWLFSLASGTPEPIETVIR